jgi:hypothetical protein
MYSSRSRILLFAGLAIILLLVSVLGVAVLVHGWPPFEVKDFSWK